MKMHNKFNKEIFIMVSIIKSKAPKLTTTVHFEMYLLLSCEHFMIVLRDD